jgi:hypothetical protein
MILVVVSLVLLAFSGILFSASLWIGQGLESHGRSDHVALLRANERYWLLFPLQLISVAVVAGIFQSLMHRPGALSQAGWWFKGLLFVLLFVGLLVFDYLGGVILFDRFGLSVVRWLEQL